MARAGVTFSEVDEAARYLQGLGRNPTVDAIREKLGTGSRTTLAEHLRHWKALQADGEGRLPQPLMSLVTGLWESLQSAAEQRVNELRSSTHQETAQLRAQLHTAQQTIAKHQQEHHQLEEALDAEQREKSALNQQLQSIEKSHELLNAKHHSLQKQFDDAKQENKRLHALATQIQVNLEHYQQAISQQQVEQNLAKEKQHAVYAQELIQLRTLLEEVTLRANQSEKALAASEFQLQQIQKNHSDLLDRYKKTESKNHDTEHKITQLTAEAKHHQEQAEKNELALSTERESHNQLQLQAAVLADKLQRTESNLCQAEDKVATLRHEKLFLVQEKSQLDGALKQLQRTKIS